MPRRGLFVVFEGIDGSGKSTQVNLLIKHIESVNKYIDILRTHEPWRNSEIKNKLQKDKGSFSDGLKMAELYVKDRVVHTKFLIDPCLKKGIFVICDRYSMSTLAYQWAQGINLNKLLSLHKGKGILIPDVVFLFDLKLSEATKRKKTRGLKADKFEKDKTFIKELIKKYKKLAEMARQGKYHLPFKKIIIINANQSVEKMAENIKKNFDEIYKKLMKNLQ